MSRSLPASSAFLLRRPAVGFSGSRHGAGAGLLPLLSVLPAALGSRVLVGCARGVDVVVREHVSAEVFQAASRRPAARVARSVALVSALAACPGAVLVVVPGLSCWSCALCVVAGVLLWVGFRLLGFGGSRGGFGCHGVGVGWLSVVATVVGLPSGRWRLVRGG